MRAIIIEDKDAAALLDQLKLESMDKDLNSYMIAAKEEWHKLPPSTRDEIVHKLHRKFHFIVCRWLQEQGANVTR